MKILSPAGALLALALLLTPGGGAQAASAYSSKHYIGSAFIWSYAYISSADRNQCGTWQSWTRFQDAPNRVSWVRDHANFKQYGIGTLTIGSSSSGTVTAAETTISWENTNGAKGAYLSGDVCLNYGAVYAALQTTGAGFYNGTARYPATRWL